MGCDIHAYVEFKGPYADGHEPWELANRPIKDKYGVSDYYAYSGRNYALFAILANIRNYSKSFNPISPPKGLPINRSDTVRRISEEWRLDGHSHSYFTLRELLEYDWDQTIIESGVVDAEVYDEWKESGNAYPRTLDTNIGDSNVIILSESDYIEAKKKGKTLDEYVCVKTQWTVKYKDCAEIFLTRYIPRMKQLANVVGGIDNVRLVFFFDN